MSRWPATGAPSTSPPSALPAWRDGERDFPVSTATPPGELRGFRSSGVMLQEFGKPGKFRNSGIMLQKFRVFRNYQIKLDKKIINHYNKNKLVYCDTAWWVQGTLMIINYVCEISLKTGNIWMYKYFLHFLQFTYDSA